MSGFEVAGVAIGIAPIVFKAVAESMRILEDTVRFDDDTEPLVIRIETAKAHLSIWATSVGLVEGELVPALHPLGDLIPKNDDWSLADTSFANLAKIRFLKPGRDDPEAAYLYEKKEYDPNISEENKDVLQERTSANWSPFWANLAANAISKLCKQLDTRMIQTVTAGGSSFGFR
ncbi:unnamed protein product [Alternaria alternata]